MNYAAYSGVYAASWGFTVHIQPNLTGLIVLRLVSLPVVKRAFYALSRPACPVRELTMALPVAVLLPAVVAVTALVQKRIVNSVRQYQAPVAPVVVLVRVNGQEIRNLLVVLFFAGLRHIP
ncbi:hypothetical protein GTE46_001428 [Salmonella enterica subsp. enterica]|nr:hypothetical protein [Salmonella enterica subsp. enterica]EDY2800140.1 hypothetical protein [Salmonella enterica subsp. enterica]